MRETMSSSASTSTAIKRHPSVPTSSSSSFTFRTSSTTAPGSKCRCCPYGFHIDLGFVSYAHDVTNGFISRQGTPTMHHVQNAGGVTSNGGSNGHTDRQLMSPLDSIFSDSLENLMSDFEEALAPHKVADQKPREKDVNEIRNRHQNGYLSDYTVYRRGSSDRSARPALEIAPSPKPASRPSQHSNNLYNGSRSNTPTIGAKPSGYATALAKTVSEIRARNAESPFPGQESQLGSRVGTPIDLGLNSSQQNGGATNHYVPNGFHQSPYQCHTPSRLQRNEFQDYPPQLPPTPTPSTFRRAPSQGDIPSRLNGGGGGSPGEFASLRRGREYVINDGENSNSRHRYFSASPKLPRRLQIAPSVEDSHFTYSHQNGNTVLARTQATCTSPTQEDAPKLPFVPKVMRSIAVSTGPLPPAKPCSECPNLKRELNEAINKKPPPPPETSTVGVATDTKTLVDSATGDTIKTFNIAVGTEVFETKDCGVDAPITRQLHIDTQTEEMTTVDTASSPIVFDDETRCMYSQTNIPPQLLNFGVNTDVMEEIEKASTNEQHTMTTVTLMVDFDCQTDTVVEEEVVLKQEVPAVQVTVPSISVTCEASCQTSQEEDNLANVESAEAVEKPESEDCSECVRRRDTFTRNVGVGSCSVADKICVSCDTNVQEVDENEAPGFKAEADDAKQREFEVAKTNAVKKLLTNEQKSNKFQRGTVLSKSARFERKKSIDDLDYIIDQQKRKTSPQAPSVTTTPSGDNSEALKGKVVLKKEQPPQPSKVPEPVPARIPRPKISKYASPEEHAETPDEEEEAQDRLTPLRSELRSLGNRWPRNNTVSQVPYTATHDDLSDSDAESDCSAVSDGTFDVIEDVLDEGPFEVSSQLREALENFNSNLLEPGSVPVDTVEWADRLVQHEWMKTAARKVSRYDHVDKFVDELRNLGPMMLTTVVNIADQNGNTVLHYAVSHANFSVVSSLLDCGECQLNTPNKAGYTAVMLAALSSLEDDMERAVVQRLFEMGDVNARATEHGQTALMLAVSHGRRATTELLLICDADVNIQDGEGSTALMCAAEHGHKDLVKILLSQPKIDASLTDCDNSTALTIAVENGYRDIGVLIYAHQNYTKLDNMQPTSTI